MVTKTSDDENVSRFTSRKQNCGTCGNDAVPGQRWCNPCHAAYMRTWRTLNPPTTFQRIRDAARSYVSVYLKRGKIQRGQCSQLDYTCKGRIEAHHEDYSKPLEVNWLCRSHHVRLECAYAGNFSRVYPEVVVLAEAA